MIDKDYLLFVMIVCYIIPIYYVYYYNCNNSISSIICDDECKYIILYFMIFMGIFTFLYELERNDTVSIVFITLLLICIFGLIMINEENYIHYVFAYLVFIIILFFMCRHYYLTHCNIVLFVSLLVACILLVILIMNIDDNIFYSEVMYILNFAFFYLYLHFI